MNVLGTTFPSIMFKRMKQS